MRNVAVAFFLMAGFAVVVACGDDPRPKEGPDAASDAGASNVGNDAGSVTTLGSPRGDAASEIIIGDAGLDATAAAASDADADAGPRIEPPPAVDGGPCDAFYEEWNIDDDGGAWIPGTTWTFSGPAPDVRYLPIHGGYFTTSAASSLRHSLVPSCHYTVSLPIVPPSPMPADLTFLRLTNTDPSATVAFALTSSTDDAGAVHGFISIRIGGEEVLKNEIDPTGLTGVGVIYTKQGSLMLGTDQNQSNEFFFGPDAGAFPGFDAIEVGVVSGPTPSPESLYFGVVSTQWNDTL